MYDNVYPKILTGKKSDGSIVQFSLCPDDNDFVQLIFDEHQVGQQSLTLQVAAMYD